MIPPVIALYTPGYHSLDFKPCIQSRAVFLFLCLLFFFFASTLRLCVCTGLLFIGFHFGLFYFINGPHLMAPSATDKLPRGSQWGFLGISVLASSGDPCVWIVMDINRCLTCSLHKTGRLCYKSYVIALLPI